MSRNLIEGDDVSFGEETITTVSPLVAGVIPIGGVKCGLSVDPNEECHWAHREEWYRDASLLPMPFSAPRRPRPTLIEFHGNIVSRMFYFPRKISRVKWQQWGILGAKHMINLLFNTVWEIGLNIYLVQVLSQAQVLTAQECVPVLI